MKHHLMRLGPRGVRGFVLCLLIELKLHHTLYKRGLPGGFTFRHCFKIAWMHGPFVERKPRRRHRSRLGSL